MTSFEFRLKKLMKQEFIFQKKKNNDLTREKHKKACKYLNYVEDLLILTLTVSGCVSSSAFTSLVAVLEVLQ